MEFLWERSSPVVCIRVVILLINNNWIISLDLLFCEYLSLTHSKYGWEFISIWRLTRCLSFFAVTHIFLSSCALIRRNVHIDPTCVLHYFRLSFLELWVICLSSWLFRIILVSYNIVDEYCSSERMLLINFCYTWIRSVAFDASISWPTLFLWHVVTLINDWAFRNNVHRWIRRLYWINRNTSCCWALSSVQMID